jgi:hypothetical protein
MCCLIPFAQNAHERSQYTQNHRKRSSVLPTSFVITTRRNSPSSRSLCCVFTSHLVKSNYYHKTDENGEYMRMRIVTDLELWTWPHSGSSLRFSRSVWRQGHLVPKLGSSC